MTRMTVFPAAIVKYSMTTTSGRNKVFLVYFQVYAGNNYNILHFTINIVPANLHVQQHFLAIRARSRMKWTTFDSLPDIVELSGVVAKSDI